MPILAGGPFGLGLGLPTKPSQTEQQVYNQAYFTGLAGLGADDRASWEKKYAKEIAGLDDEEKDNYFRNTVFMDIFGNSDDEEDQKIFANRSSLTRDQRDSLVARKAISSDIDAMSDLQESSINVWKALTDADYKYSWLQSKMGEDTARQGAMRHLEEKGLENYDLYYNNLMSLDSASLNKMVEDMDSFSGEISSYYKMYNGTDKLNLTPEEKVSLLATYLSNESVGGTQFAAKALGNAYQDIVASNQSLLEKTWNSGAQFIDSAAGMIIRAAGMVGGLAGGLFGYGQEEDEGYWENLLNNTIDNDVTRYGDNVATTNSYSPEEQERLKSLGMSDNPILNTVDQQNSILSANTPFELFGQYGFTAASTILSFGGSAVVNGAVKGAGWLAKAANAGRGLNTTARGIKMTKAIIKSKEAANLMVAGAVGTVEGGMNAAMTKEETLKGMQEDISNRYREQAAKDVDEFVTTNPDAAIGALMSLGYKREELPLPNLVPAGPEGEGRVAQYSPEQIQQMQQMLKSNPQALDNFMQKYQGAIASDMKAAEESANTAMYWDFWTNSVINGMINCTLQATLQAPSIQRSLRKFGIGKSNSFDDMVRFSEENGLWRATARQATKWDVIKNRVRESIGEGLEEYTQDISSAFAGAYAEDKMQQYLDKKYGGQPGATAAENDMWQSLGAGFMAAGETMLSQEALKSGLYGGLSTLLGGPNVNMTRGKAGRADNESSAAYFARRSPISWRSAVTPLFNNRERNEINEQREKVAEHLNEFFSNKEVQDAIFNIEGTSAWMTEMQRAIESNDEKAARDARLGAILGHIITLNSLEGTGYHTVAVGALQARANFDEANLQDPESAESKAVQQYLQSAQNRGQNISAKEALTQMKKSATEMLKMMKQVEKETADIEKIFGQNLDADVKSSMVFNRLVIDDYKKRSEQLDREISQVTAELNKTPSEGSSLSSRARSLVARYGSLSNAEKPLSKLRERKAEVENAIKEINNEETTSEEEKQVAQMTASYLKAQLGTLNATIKNIESLGKAYRRTAETVAQFDENGDARGQDVADVTVLSAQEIMTLPAMERAMMLSEKNKSRYSQEQQAEIDKVNNIGTSIHQDFSKKVNDRGRIERDYQQAMQAQYALMQNPTALNAYVNKVKYATQKRLLKEKNSGLVTAENEGDYNTFATSLDGIYTGRNEAEIDAVNEMLQGSAFYERYKSEKQQQGQILDYIDDNNLIAEDDTPARDTFAATLDYLYSREIDPMSDEAVNHLAAWDIANDVSPLEEYFRSIEDQAPEGNKPVFTSVAEAIQTFKDVMDSYKAHVAETERNTREVVPADTDESQAAPPVAPEPAGPVSLFDMGYSSPEGGQITPEGGLINTETVIEQTEPSQPEVNTEVNTETEQADPIIEDFRENSSDEVADAAEIALRTVENTPNFTQESKEKAKKIISDLSQNSFDSVEEFTDALTARANTIDSNSEEGEEQSSGLLRQAVAKVNKTQVESRTEVEEKKPSSYFDRRRKSIERQNRAINYNMYPNASPTSAFIAGVNIANVRQRFPNSPLVKYYDQYHIEDYLKSGKLNRNSAIMFITDPTLTEVIKNDMGENYTEASLPIVAVVETSNGPIEIDRKHYQPISVMASTDKIGSAGSTHMGPIRNLAASNTGTQLVRNTDGSPVVTTLYGNIKAESVDNGYTGPNNSVIDIALEDVTPDERAQVEAMDKASRRQSPVYQRVKKAFLSKLGVKALSDTRKMAIYRQDNLKGGFNSMFLFIPSLNETTGRDTDMTLEEAFRTGNIEDVVNFNSRTSRAVKVLTSIMSAVPDGMTFARNQEGTLTPTGNTASMINTIASNIEGQISNFLNVPSKAGWSYRVTPTDKLAGENRLFSVDLVNSNGEAPIHLTDIHTGMTEEEIQRASYEFLKNLITDEAGAIRMVNEKDSFVKWNVPYSDIEQMGENSKAAQNLSDIYDDGLFEARATALDYRVLGIAVNNPFKSDGTPVYTTTVNSTNAQPSTPLNRPTVVANDQVESGGALVDSETGAVIEGTPQAPVNQELEKARRIVERIVADTSEIQLAEDGKGYVNTRTGQRYARVTSIIAADEEAGERFDPNSPWALPSTNIGTGIDEFVRDFFAGVATDLSKYPNATQEAYERFREQLQGLKNTLDANGLTVVPRDVTVTGSIEVADTNGQIHTIDVAGTLDLLAYDGNGNFFIFDMKTMRSGIDQHKQEKYARQLSVYKKLLEAKYGVKVKSLQIIPIKVEYPAPAGWRNGTAAYSVSPEKPNQLLIDGRNYTGANPTLQNMMALNYREPRIMWERLTDDERAMFSGIEETLAEQTGEEVTPVEAQVAEDQSESTDELGFDSSFMDNIFGEGSSDFAGFDMTERLTPVPVELQWDNLTREQREGLEMMGITQTQWENLTDDEMQHQLGCL